MPAIKLIKPSTNNERRTRTVVDTIIVKPETVNQWQAPPFQRPVRENDKVRALAEELKQSGGVWPGIVTLGVLDGKCYIIDGQHRRAAFIISGLAEGYTDVRTHYFSSAAEMGEEFVRLNTQLVKMRPDDILRGMEAGLSSLQIITRICPYVGYDYIRRNERSPVLSMSMVLRNWYGSSKDVPMSGAGGMSAYNIAANMSDDDAKDLCGYLAIAYAAFGRDQEYQRLWGSLTLCLTMWLYHHAVMTTYSPKVHRFTRDEFRKCLSSLSADAVYLDWLVGRQMTDRDRTPGYSRIRAIFASRMFSDTGKKILMPQPAWAH